VFRVPKVPKNNRLDAPKVWLGYLKQLTAYEYSLRIALPMDHWWLVSCGGPIGRVLKVKAIGWQVTTVFPIYLSLISYDLDGIHLMFFAPAAAYRVVGNV
jgi:hypothetical protein